jgi:ATP-dependent Clp protease ATP-binding subunit ClpA
MSSLPLTPSVKRIIADAEKQAILRGRECVDSSDLLLSIISYDRSVASRILSRLGISRSQVLELAQILEDEHAEEMKQYALLPGYKQKIREYGKAIALRDDEMKKQIREELRKIIGGKLLMFSKIHYHARKIKPQRW